jgi:hypothetical protein
MKYILKNIDNIDNENKIEFEIFICNDISGNIYININESYYFLNIDSNDDLEWIYIENFNNLQSTHDEINYLSIKNTSEKYSLKDKIEKELNEKEKDIESEYMDENNKSNHKYYPENSTCIPDDENDDDEDKPNYYKFSKFGNENLLQYLDKSLTLSIFDTFIFNSSNELIQTITSYEESAYRVSIFSNQTIQLNIIGSKIKKYDMYYKIDIDDNINIICIKSDTKLIL